MNYENLPVYKETLELLVFVYKTTINVERQYRYTLVEELKKSLQEILIHIYTANTVYDKQVAITNARQELVRVRVFIRLMKELKQLSLKQLAFVIDKIASLSKQLAAWEKYVIAKQ